jgi:methylmalonyl-CoA/ethylmalonyl-CoA epimerase
MMEIHHIGYAVSDIESAIEQMCVLGYAVGEIVVDNNRSVRIAFAHQGTYCVELISPNADDSPVSKILQKNGPTPYHICYLVDDMEESLLFLKSQKWVVIVSPAAAIAFNGRNVAFLYHRSLGLIELLAR